MEGLFDVSKKEVKAAVIIIMVALIIYLLYLIKMALLPFLFGIVLAYLFNPFIVYLKKRNFSRQGAILILVIFVFNIIFISGLFLFPTFINELNNLTVMIPKYINSIGEIINDINQKYKQIQMPGVIQQSLDKFLTQIQDFIINFIQKITEVLLNSIPYIVSLIISPIITYYLLRDIEDLKKIVIKNIPNNYKKICFKLGQEINQIFVGYLRGQIWVSIIVGILSGVGLFFLKVKFNLILGLVSGLTNMIPYIGPIIGAIPAVFISFLASPLQALGVVLLYLFIQQLEGGLIAPKIMSENVGLHPLTIILALLAGAELAGVWGLIFGVPVVGVLKVFLKLLLYQIIQGEKAG